MWTLKYDTNELMVAGYGHVHPVIFKIASQPGLTVPEKELCSMLYGSLDGRRVWGRMDTYICMTEFLCCSPKTVTLVNRLSLNTK